MVVAIRTTLYCVNWFIYRNFIVSIRCVRDLLYHWVLERLCMMSYNVEHCSDSPTQPRLSKLNSYSMSAAHLTLRYLSLFSRSSSFCHFSKQVYKWGRMRRDSCIQCSLYRLERIGTVKSLFELYESSLTYLDTRWPWLPWNMAFQWIVLNLL